MRLLAILLVLVTVAPGVWVAGAVVTNDFRASMALTTVRRRRRHACVTIARRSRALRLPVLGSYVVAVVAIGGYLGLTTVRERVADERLVSGGAVLHGDFRSGGKHDTRGVASVVEAGGRRFLTLTSFATSRPAPTCGSVSCPATPRTAARTARGNGRPRRAEGQPRRPAVPAPRRPPPRGADGRDLVPDVQRAVRAGAAGLVELVERAAADDGLGPGAPPPASSSRRLISSHCGFSPPVRALQGQTAPELLAVEPKYAFPPAIAAAIGTSLRPVGPASQTMTAPAP